MSSSKNYFNPYREDMPEVLSDYNLNDIRHFHASLPGYEQTSLVSLPGLAKNNGVGALLVKDESSRFDLKSFKVLGAAYGAFKLLQKMWQAEFNTEIPLDQLLDKNNISKLGDLTFAAATDGNHGRAIAWTARILGINAVIYVPDNMAGARIEAIKSEGAEVITVNGTYDEAMARAEQESEKNGCLLVQDSSWEGYQEIPVWIMQGYQTLFDEAYEQMEKIGIDKPDLVFIQAGVGSFAGAAAIYHVSRFGQDRPTMICVEPMEADCLFSSITSPDGQLTPTQGLQDSIMSGLNCGIPSMISWPINRATYDLFQSIDDSWAELAMKALYQHQQGAVRVIAGESGAAGLAGLMAILGEPVLEGVRERLNISSDTTVLIVNTEGDTDPESFRNIVGT